MGASTQIPGAFAPDGSQYATITDGNGNLITNGNLNLSTSGSTKSFNNLYAPDGSIYTTLTDGNNNVLGTIPSWVLSGATVDVDLSNNRAWSSSTGVTTPSNFLSISRASNETYTDSSGNLSYITSNTLANGNAGLQIWEGRTNLILQSGAINNTNWLTFQSSATLSLTANSSVAPDGTSTATLAVMNRAASSGQATCATDFTGTVATYAGSIYLKASTPSDIGLAVSVSLWNGSGFVGIQNVILASTWQRVTSVGGLAVSATCQIVFGYIPSSSGGGSQTGTVNFLVWGGQAELGAFASPYIPTTTATAVRAADSITATGTLLTALQGPAVSVFASAGPSSTTGGGTQLGGPDLQFGQNGNTTVFSAINSHNLTSTLGSGTYTSGIVKQAVSTSSSGRSLVGNNGTVTTDAFALGFNGVIGNGGGGYWNRNTQRLTVWNTRLTDAALKALTQ